MMAEAKRNPSRDDVERNDDEHKHMEDERKHMESVLDEALEDTFPASDPVSIEQPTPPAADRRIAKP
jgi:hypothetical protein